MALHRHRDVHGVCKHVPFEQAQEDRAAKRARGIGHTQRTKLQQQDKLRKLPAQHEDAGKQHKQRNVAAAWARLAHVHTDQKDLPPQKRRGKVLAQGQVPD